jgi:hypothetical protein
MIKPIPTDLEQEFHKGMIDIYRQAKEAGYVASRFLQMVSECGGVEAAKTLINSPTPSDGYTELFKMERLDLTVETFVVKNPKWHPLFELEEIERARKRLKDFGYLAK